MRTKIVYCLVSDNEDYYYEQLLISICSLRKYNPQTVVEVICDNLTFATLKDNRLSINVYNVQIKPIEIPKENLGKIERSRYLKTNLRNLTQGDYLFLDTDTIICSCLDFIDEFEFDVAAVKCSHLETQLPRHSQCQNPSEIWIWGEAQKANINIEGLWHYNSGVLYVKDTKSAHELYNKWHNKYRAQLKYGIKIDQLSLLLANHEMNNIITPLDHKLNCQVVLEKGKNMLPDVYVIHYFPNQHKTLLSSSWILDPVKETGKVNTTILRIIDDPFAFFEKESCIAVGAAASLIDTPSLLAAYVYSPKAFKFFATILDNYVHTKRSIHNMVLKIFH